MTAHLARLRLRFWLAVMDAVDAAWLVSERVHVRILQRQDGAQAERLAAVGHERDEAQAEVASLRAQLAEATKGTDLVILELAGLRMQLDAARDDRDAARAYLATLLEGSDAHDHEYAEMLAALIRANRERDAAERTTAEQIAAWAESDATEGLDRVGLAAGIRAFDWRPR